MNRDELNSIIKSDSMRFEGHAPGLKDFILHNESFFIYRYILHMRHIEYYQGKKFWRRAMYLWHWYWLKCLQFKLHLSIYPNTLGPGFRIYHIGAFTHVGPNVRIGKNCTMVSGVVFGNKDEKGGDCPVYVGDNCYFGIDCKILGSVRIGNNVLIGANSIITKDIPDNSVVIGVNKIIKNR